MLLPELANNSQYEVIRELGRGGMGVVYLARNRLLARQEVLKVVNKGLLERSGGKERFLREIQSAAMLSHTNVVRAYSALQLGDMLVFAMEYVDGDDLAKVVKANGPLPVANACFYAHQAALGLQHAFEKNMVHRDIKPQNLILACEGKKHLIKILDFGLAKVLREKREVTYLTGTGQMMGTPDFVAPEQILDAARADIRADIYSLGCTLYYLLMGGPPFHGKSLYELLQAHHTVTATALNLIHPKVSAELAAVVAKMMAKEPANRYQKPIEVAQALVPFIKAAVKVPAAASPATPQAATSTVEAAKQSTSNETRVVGETLPNYMPPPVRSLPVPSKVQAGFPRTTVAPATSKTLTEPLPWILGLAAFARKKKRLIGVSATACVAIVALLVLWSIGLFRPQPTNVPPTASPGLEVSKQDEVVEKEKAKTAVLTDLKPEKTDQGLLKSGTNRKLDQHVTGVRSVAWSGDGKRLAVTGGVVWSDIVKRFENRGDLVTVWDATTGQELHVLRSPYSKAGDPGAVAWSYDGKRLASVYWNGRNETVCIWDGATGNKIVTFGGHTGGVRCIVWSPDDNRLASASEDYTVKVRDPATGAEVLTLRGHEDMVNCVVWSPDGRRLATASWDKTIRIWDAATGQLLRTFGGYKGGVYAVTWSGDGKRLASAGRDEEHAVRIWDTTTNKTVQTLRGHTDEVTRVAWHGPTDRLASASSDRTVKIWNMATAQDMLTLGGLKEVISSMAWSPDGKRLLTGTYKSTGEQTLKIWELGSSKPTFKSASTP